MDYIINQDVNTVPERIVVPIHQNLLPSLEDAFLFTIKKRKMKKKVINGKHLPENFPKSGEGKLPLLSSKSPKPENRNPKELRTDQKTKKSNPPPGYSPGDPLELSKWMSTRQLLEEFPVSTRSLYNWRKKRLLPFLFFEGKLLYDRTAFERILKSRWNIESH